jgi:methionyl-tRNA formyltransferase
MREKMDAGPVLAQHRIEITEDMNARDLYREMTALGPAFLAENLSRYGSGELTPRSQPDEEATYCRMIRKEDGLIQWDRPAPEVHNRIRAFALWPVAYTFLDGKMLRVHRSALCGEGAAGEGSTLDGSQGGIPGSHESGSGTRGTVPGTIVKTDRQRGVLVQAGQGCVRLLEVQPANRKAMSHLEFMNGYRDLTGKVLG